MKLKETLEVLGKCNCNDEIYVRIINGTCFVKIKNINNLEVIDKLDIADYTVVNINAIGKDEFTIKVQKSESEENKENEENI